MKSLYRIVKKIERAGVLSAARRLHVMGYKQEAKNLLESTMD